MLGKKVNILLLTLLTLLSTATFAAVHTQYSTTVCSNQPYLFGCDTYTAKGAPSNTLGDSTVTVNLTFGSQQATAYTATIEPGQKYLFGCKQLTADGDVWSNTLQQLACGCDSTVTVTLQVQAPAPVPMKVVVGYDATIETGETYLFGCQKLTAAGEYKDTLHLAGKDSITVLTLSVGTPAPTEVVVGYDASIETGETYLFGCQKLTAAGEYKDTLHLAGKDSITVLTLSVVTPAPTEVMVQYDTEIEVGETYLLGCKTYQFADAGPQTLKDTLHLAGKDSIVIVNLTVAGGGAAAADTTVAYTATIEQGETYLFGCQKLTVAGEYKDTLARVNLIGDSITVLTLQIAAPVAQDTAVAYTTEIMPGETYLFGCKTYNAAGTYADTLPRIGVLGDSIINLTLTIGCTNDTVYMTNPVIACGMYHWAIDDQDYVNSGTYYYDNGPITPGSTCHEYYELKLTILEPAHGTDAVEGCDSVIFKGVKYTASTTVNDTLVGLAANGCDSIVTVTITVNQHATGTDAVEGCESVIFKGVTYTADAVVYDTIAGGAANGCDSIVAVTITVKHHAEGVDAIDGCESVTFKGVTYTADALVYDTIVGGAANGCDSIVAVTITIKHHAEGVDALEGCDSVIFKGVKYTADALVYDTIVGGAANGCDSIVAVTITVKHSTASEETAEACDSYEWHSNTYTASGDYTYTTTNAAGCDSVVTLHLTIHNSVATTEEAGEVCNAFYWAFADTLITNTGSYKHTEQTIHGCDSTVTLNVTINTPYVDTLEVRGYYGDRIIMINRNQINSIPGWNQALDSIDNGEGYVKWFKMQGATPDPETDPQVATGYFYTLETGDPLPAGMYYATVEIPASDAAKCGAIGTTEIYTVAGAAPAPALMPSLARPGEDIRVVNLDPKVETVIRVYTADGMLQQTFNVSDAESYTIQAGYNHGFYLVELVSDNMKSTLRYIVK